MKTFKEVLESYNFQWDSSTELWVRKEGFGMKSTVDVMFKNLFIIFKGKTKVHDHFVESFEDFKRIMVNNFS